MARVRTGARILAAAVVVALAGCAGSPAKPAGPTQRRDSRTATALIAALKTALAGARSVHVAGEVAEGGSTDHLNLALTRSGLSGSIQSAGTTLDIIDPGQLAYIKVTSAFLALTHAPASVCHRVCGKYVATPASQGKKIIGNLSMSGLLSELSDSLPRYVRAGATTVGGQQALILHGTDGSTLDVAAAGPPYPLRAVAPSSSAAGELEFSQWNAVPPIVAPAASQVISLSQLAG
jgi:hypothetical protein